MSHDGRTPTRNAVHIGTPTMRPSDCSDALDPSTRAYLLALARRALAEAMGRPDAACALPPAPSARRLREPARLFVSWHLGDRLVGCIGTVQPSPSLQRGVAHYATQAGLHDLRTPVLQVDELPRLACEISLLTEPRPIDVMGLEAIGRCVVPREHGVILSVAGRRAVFLPVVWNHLRGVSAFLRALCRKAGADPDTEGARATAELFTTEVFGDGPAVGDTALEEIS
jgi:uncharacterized protein